MIKLHKLLAALLAAAACCAHADLQDEIQVYDDAINAPGETGLEMHVNTTPRGRSTPDYPGEVVPNHALRITPEFSWGYTRTLELGLYVPTVIRPDGRFDAAGVKVRAKWLPVQPSEGSGAFAGVNVELSHLARRYSESPSSLETRFIAGWRNAQWLVAVNPTFEFALSSGFSRRPDFDLGIKVARTIGEGLAGGVELYCAPGPWGDFLPLRQQDDRLYLALDIDRKPWVVNVGIGRGLTHAADPWTLKAIFELPLGH